MLAICLFYLIRHDLTTVFVLCIVSVHERSSHKARRIFIDIILLLRRLRRRRRGAHKSDDNINSKICERARAWRRVAVKGFTKTVLTRSWNKSETHCATLARFKSCATHPEIWSFHLPRTFKIPFRLCTPPNFQWPAVLILICFFFLLIVAGQRKKYNWNYYFFCLSLCVSSCIIRDLYIILTSKRYCLVLMKNVIEICTNNIWAMSCWWELKASISSRTYTFNTS